MPFFGGQPFFSQFFVSKKNIINRQNGVFDIQKHFFCSFSKIPTKRTFVCLLFLKLNQSRNTNKRNFWEDILQKPKKRTFLVIQNGTFKKSNFKFVFLRLFNVKGSFMPIFTQKILIFRPPGIFRIWKLWHALAQIIWIWTSYIIPDLWLVCSDQKKFPHSTLLNTWAQRQNI